MKFFKTTLVTILSVVFVSTITKWLFFTIYTVPTDSMLNTIKPDDKILVKRIINWSANTRLPVHRNDIMVFYAQTVEQNLVKRCIGLPGDKVAIMNSNVYINDTIVNNRAAIFDYELTGSKTTNPIGAGNPLENQRLIKTISDDSAKYLERSNMQTIKLQNRMKKNYVIFPGNKNGIWSDDTYGPLTVPKRSMIIKLDSLNAALYEQAIRYEGHTLAIKQGGHFLIDGKPAQVYRFTRDHYFMLGDNRHHSIDSRYLGFISQQDMIGKAIFAMRKDTSSWCRYKLESLTANEPQ